MSNNGWNRPAANEPKVTKKSEKKFSLLHGLIAGAVVVVLGFAVLAILSGGDEEFEAKATKERGRIKEVTPAVSHTNTVAATPAPIDKSKLSPAWQKYYDGRDTNKWVVVYNPITKKEYLARKVRTGLKNPPPKLYESHALNLLDAIAFKPVVTTMANVRIDERFMASLQQAMVEKIVVDPNDPEDIKLRKQGMISLMDDLRSQLKQGADIQKIIADALAERNSVAQFKKLMQIEKRRMEESGASDDEIEEYVDICNKKLAERGATLIQTRRIVEKRIDEKLKAQQEQGK